MVDAAAACCDGVSARAVCGPDMRGSTPASRSSAAPQAAAASGRCARHTASRLACAGEAAAALPPASTLSTMAPGSRLPLEPGVSGAPPACHSAPGLGMRRLVCTIFETTWAGLGSNLRRARYEGPVHSQCEWRMPDAFAPAAAPEDGTLPGPKRWTMAARRRDAAGEASPLLTSGSSGAAMGGTTHRATSCLHTMTAWH